MMNDHDTSNLYLKKTQIKDWNPIFYHDNCFMQIETSKNILFENKLDLKNKSILEVGSGCGILADFLSNEAKEIYGIDASKSMVEFAKEKYKNEKIKYLNSDVTEFYIEKKFDFILSFWTLSWVLDQESAIKNMLTHLQKDGRLFVMYPMRHNAYEILKHIAEKEKWRNYFLDFIPRPFLSKENYEKIVEKLGIEKDALREIDIEYTFKDKDQMKQSAMSWISYLDKLPPDKIDEFLSDFIILQKKEHGLKMKFKSLILNWKKK